MTRVPRFFVAAGLVPGARLSLPKEAAHHAVRVLRLTLGSPLRLFDGRGGEFEARIERAGREVWVHVGAAVANDRESPLVVHLAQGISSGERMDYTLQKATELGVSAVQPLLTERSIVRLSEEQKARRVRHWQSVVVHACGQCGRSLVPEVASVVSLRDWLGGLGGVGPRLVLDPEATSRLAELPAPRAPVWLLVGPEGGLSPAEREDALRMGFHPVRLGPRILRTETAAVAALAAMQALWGDF